MDKFERFLLTLMVTTMVVILGVVAYLLLLAFVVAPGKTIIGGLLGGAAYLIAQKIVDKVLK